MHSGRSKLGAVIAALGPVTRFAVGPAVQNATQIALHRALSGRPWIGEPIAMALAAQIQQVAVWTSVSVPELAPHLRDVVAYQRRVDALLELGLAHAARVLAGLSPVVLLKGSAAGSWVYPDSACRQRRDLDLLVGDSLPEIRRVLLGRGWKDANDPRNGSDPAVGRAWNMSVDLGGGRINLDLHRTLVHTAWCRPDVVSMLAQRVTGRAPLPVTSAADTFVTTVIHLLGTGFHEPLKGWIDLLRLLPHVMPDELAKRSRVHGIVSGVWLCLGVLSRWFGAAVDAYRTALGRPLQGSLLEYLAAGEHATPERQPLPRGVSYRLWPALVRDIGAGFSPRSAVDTIAGKT